MKKIIIFITIALFLLCVYYLNTSKNIEVKNYTYNVKIYRDGWGVPHIYGETDEDAAYGLAYAHAEDDFITIQDVLLAGRGKLASVKGKDSAPIDYLVGLLKVWETVENRYEVDLSQKMKSVCNAYADGINRFIEKNQDLVYKGVYPVKGKDIIAGFVFRTPLMYELDWYIKKLMDEAEPDFTSYANKNTDYSMYGSNVFAVSPLRTDDGSTRLAINSHQPWDGPVAWYEAHIQSNEGWNISGGLFPGSPVIFKGYNKDLGWSHTVNDPDLVDIYKLVINENDKNKYLLDGKWKQFERTSLPINVKLFGPFNWTFNRILRWSVHGPVIETDYGVYALRYAGSGLAGQVEQWYRMNKSTNLSEFKDAMNLQQIPMFNTMYADKEGNIYYIYNALIPNRDIDVDWKNILPGDNSDLIWSSYYDIENLPQVTNPESGYLQNCNSSPYKATIGKDKPKDELPLHAGIETFQTNRAYRANELFSGDNSISKDDFYNFKYDAYYSKSSAMYYALNRFVSEVQTDDANLIEGVELLKRWDLNNNKENTAAALAMMTFKLKFNIEEYIYNYEETFDRFKESVNFLIDNYGQINIPLGEFQRLRRGQLNLPLDGAPDVLRAIYSKVEGAQSIASHGDCFFQMVEWDIDGNVTAESIHQYGSATSDSSSNHYSDQSHLFSNMKMKPSNLKLENDKSIYDIYNP